MQLSSGDGLATSDSRDVPPTDPQIDASLRVFRFVGTSSEPPWTQTLGQHAR